jgi:hypothetical protein
VNHLTFFAVVILSLAVFRVVRLLIEDTLLEPLREATIFKLHPTESKIRELFTCPWCIGFWLSLVAVVLFYFWPVVVLWLALPFAISAVVGLIASHWG